MAPSSQRLESPENPRRFRVTHLPLFDPVHPFDAPKGGAGGTKGLKAQHGSRDSFDRSVILFDQIVEVLPLPDLDFGNGVGIDVGVEGC